MKSAKRAVILVGHGGLPSDILVRLLKNLWGCTSPG